MDALPMFSRATSNERLFWVAILASCIVAFVWAGGIPAGLLFAILTPIIVFLAFVFPFHAFLASIVASPLIGLTISIPTGTLQIGERAFGGSIDITPAELIALMVLGAWALRLMFSFLRRSSVVWRPWFPLGASFALLVLAHVASALSPMDPNLWLVIKYALRPVAFAYVAWVLVPVNFIATRQRFVQTVLVFVGVASFFALDAWRALFVFDQGLSSMRLHPVPWLGISPIGENHNVLAELLVVAWPQALLLGFLAIRKQVERVWIWVACGLALTALLTFARSAWITIALQLLFLCITLWRRALTRLWNARALLALALAPLLAFMVYFSLQPGVASSTDSRATMLGVAIQAFRDSPVFGIGAGMFQDTLGRTRAYTLDFGAPLDSHGIFQKLLAETGMLGLVAFMIVLGSLVVRVRSAILVFQREHIKRAPLLLMIASVGGAFAYQVFNTTYWTAKLWLPVGLLLAMIRVTIEHKNVHDPDFLSSFS